MSSKVKNTTEKTPLRRLCAAAVVAVFPLLFTASVQAQDLNEQVTRRIEKMTERTLLFRNDSDRIPQLEYLRPDGTGVVWSAALGDKVVPVAWTASNGDDGKGALCLVFKGADIGMARDLRLCDGLDVVESGIRDARDGDPYDLTSVTRMKVALPQIVNDLAEIDQLLGRD
ncbi:hypothetical protein [Pararhizobium antarcticum]|uniref:Uncharacterized protein n=1 Tax=Pararhizobium antarcticum TaxID=1798805 RepID=A0A657LL96_9HYPH|nr:hypothetical protein [Pararhizobium antarcticum]OJF90035.1 hypothetical protein AX760_08890 [Pararhizobium antarcticum]OJF93133.1 hypothetical protein AX761_04705 [Rhizobium sp. 58]